MLIQITITIPPTGLAGPFDLFSDANGYTSPFRTQVPTDDLLLGYIVELPAGATIIRVCSVGDCTNCIDLPTNCPTTTTTTSSSTSTTTTSSTSTTTTSTTLPPFDFGWSLVTATPADIGTVNLIIDADGLNVVDATISVGNTSQSGTLILNDGQVINATITNVKTGVFTYLNAILKNGSLYQPDDKCDSCTNQLVTAMSPSYTMNTSDGNVNFTFSGDVTPTTTTTTTLPEFNCITAGLSVNNGVEGQSVTGSVTLGTIQDFDPINYLIGTNSYVASILIPAGYSNSGQLLDCSALATGSAAPTTTTTTTLPNFTCTIANLVIDSGIVGDVVTGSVAEGSISGFSPATYVAGNNFYNATIIIPAGYVNAGTTIQCSSSAQGETTTTTTTTPPTTTTTTTLSAFDCTDANVSISNGVTGDAVLPNATLSLGAITNITPANFVSGTNNYDVDVTVPAGYANTGATIVCTVSGTAVDPTTTTTTTLPLFTCAIANPVIPSGITGDSIVVNLDEGTFVSALPSTYQSGINLYTVNIQAPSGYSNSGSNITCPNIQGRGDDPTTTTTTTAATISGNLSSQSSGGGIAACALSVDTIILIENSAVGVLSVGDRILQLNGTPYVGTGSAYQRVMSGSLINDYGAVIKSDGTGIITALYQCT